jgi:hypothetical protein
MQTVNHSWRKVEFVSVCRCARVGMSNTYRIGEGGLQWKLSRLDPCVWISMFKGSEFIWLWKVW